MTDDMRAAITGEFERLSVSFSYDLDIGKCKPDMPTRDFPQYASHRVYALVAGIEINIMNFNSCLLQKHTCEKIASYLQKKGIEVKVELAGVSRTVSFSEKGNSVRQNVEEHRSSTISDEKCLEPLQKHKEYTDDMVTKGIVRRNPKVGEQVAFNLLVG